MNLSYFDFVNPFIVLPARDLKNIKILYGGHCL